LGDSIFIDGVSTALEDGTECSETSTQNSAPGYHPKERIQHSDTTKVVNQKFVMFPIERGLKQEMFYRHCSSNSAVEDPGVDGKIILSWICRKWDWGSE